MTDIIIGKSHNSPTESHGGITKTSGRIKRFFYWPKMANQVKKYVKRCQICQESKLCNTMMMPGIGQEVVTDRPFQKLYTDFLGKYPRSKNGNSYIFIVVDHFTNITFLKAMREAIAGNVIRFLVTEIFYKFGTPEVIHCDNGAQFTSKYSRT